jgi:hypothetical protein
MISKIKGQLQLEQEAKSEGIEAIWQFYPECAIIFYFFKDSLNS